MLHGKPKREEDVILIELVVKMRSKCHIINWVFWIRPKCIQNSPILVKMIHFQGWFQLFFFLFFIQKYCQYPRRIEYSEKYFEYANMTSINEIKKKKRMTHI